MNLILSLLFPFETVHITKVPTYGESPTINVGQASKQLTEAISKMSRAARVSGVSCEQLVENINAWNAHGLDITGGSDLRDIIGCKEVAPNMIPHVSDCFADDIRIHNDKRRVRQKEETTGYCRRCAKRQRSDKTGKCVICNEPVSVTGKTFCVRVSRSKRSTA